MQEENNMKKLHLLLVFILVTGQGIAQDSVTGIEIESITPSTAILFVKTSKVRKFVATVKELAADFPEEKEMKEILESIKSFRDKTGIDALDSNSLSEAGIDVERKMGLAFF
jgi:hypothetical protein